MANVRFLYFVTLGSVVVVKKHFDGSRWASTIGCARQDVKVSNALLNSPKEFNLLQIFPKL